MCLHGIYITYGSGSLALVAFYTGVRLRGIRSPSSEASMHIEGGAALAPATLPPPQDGIEWYVRMGQP